MKSRIIAWSVGLLGLCTLAGCSWERAFRNPCEMCHGCCGRGGGSASSSASAQRLPHDKADEDAARLPPDAVWKAMPIKPAAPARPIPPIAGDKKVATARTPASAASKDRPAIAPFEITPLAPTPLGLPALTEFEQAKPMTTNPDKLLLPIADDAKSPPRSALTPETNRPRGADYAELVDALNRLADKGEKIVPLQSTHIRYGQADNFQQLTGQLQQWRKTWRLRYAAVSAEDVYGGSVALEGMTDTSKLRDGQHVRVRGRLIPPEARQDSPRYIVQSMEVLD